MSLHLSLQDSGTQKKKFANTWSLSLLKKWFELRNVQNKPRSSCHTRNQGYYSCVKGLGASLSTRKKSNHNGLKPSNLLKFIGS